MRFKFGLVGLFFSHDKEQQCPLEQGWQEMGPPWTAQTSVHEVVEPSQIPLVSLGLESAQYHAGLMVQSVHFPVLMLLWQPQKSAAFSLHLSGGGRVMLAKGFQMLLFEAKSPFPGPRTCILCVPSSPGHDASLSCALGLLSVSHIPTLRIIGPGYHQQQEDGMSSKGL